MDDHARRWQVVKNKLPDWRYERASTRFPDGRCLLVLRRFRASEHATALALMSADGSDLRMLTPNEETSIYAFGEGFLDWIATDADGRVK